MYIHFFSLSLSLSRLLKSLSFLDYQHVTVYDMDDNNDNNNNSSSSSSNSNNNNKKNSIQATQAIAVANNAMPRVSSPHVYVSRWQRPAHGQHKMAMQHIAQAPEKKGRTYQHFETPWTGMFKTLWSLEGLLSIYTFIDLSIYLSIDPSIHPSIHLSYLIYFIYQSINLSFLLIDLFNYNVHLYASLKASWVLGS